MFPPESKQNHARTVLDHLTVNQWVAGSSPAGGANNLAASHGCEVLRVGVLGKLLGKLLLFLLQQVHVLLDVWIFNVEPLLYFHFIPLVNPRAK